MLHEGGCAVETGRLDDIAEADAVIVGMDPGHPEEVIAGGKRLRVIAEHGAVWRLRRTGVDPCCRGSPLLTVALVLGRAAVTFLGGYALPDVLDPNPF
ncbi:hypothetical protein [Nonomuraea sp. SYSU D8015]|uniref:hypothetical protein n=1 Tax=Nonomuraea sp. SYSU D8015 TaxID=2593644 RepID=UPI001660AC0C|nr:hypothetical protein [Nonomuraea sp. SYSU D8015]